MPPEPCASAVPDGHTIVDFACQPFSVHSAGHLRAMYSVKPDVDDDPFLRWTTLIAAVAVESGLSATISGSSHFVICAEKILASTQPVRWSGLPPSIPSGTEWKTPMPPTANGTWTTLRPSLATSA